MQRLFKPGPNRKDLPGSIDVHAEVCSGDAARYARQIVALTPVLDVVSGLLWMEHRCCIRSVLLGPRGHNNTLAMRWHVRRCRGAIMIYKNTFSYWWTCNHVTILIHPRLVKKPALRTIFTSERQVDGNTRARYFTSDFVTRMYPPSGGDADSRYCTRNMHVRCFQPPISCFHGHPWMLQIVNAIFMAADSLSRIGL